MFTLLQKNKPTRGIASALRPRRTHISWPECPKWNPDEPISRRAPNNPVPCWVVRLLTCGHRLRHTSSHWLRNIIELGPWRSLACIPEGSSFHIHRDCEEQCSRIYGTFQSCTPDRNAGFGLRRHQLERWPWCVQEGPKELYSNNIVII